MKDVRFFFLFGHMRFYHGFIHDISKIVKPLSNSLTINEAFQFFEECLKESIKIKEALITTSILYLLF